MMTSKLPIRQKKVAKLWMLSDQTKNHERRVSLSPTKTAASVSVTQKTVEDENGGEGKVRRVKYNPLNTSFNKSVKSKQDRWQQCSGTVKDQPHIGGNNNNFVTRDFSAT